MRGRLVALGVLAVAVPLAVTLAPVGPAGAITAPTVSIVCDARTGWIHSGVSGGSGWFTPNFPVQVEFRVAYGSYVTSSALGTIPAIGSSRTVEATTDAAGGLSVVGYGRGWPLRSTLFYTETVRVTVRNSAGGQLWQREETCTRDLRSAVTLSCDQQAHTVTAQTSGLRYHLPRPNQVRVEYTFELINQPDQGSPAFGTTAPGPTHTAAPDSAGAFTDTGFVHAIPDPQPYFHSERIWVVVRDSVSGVIVGRGTAGCVYSGPGSG